MLLINLHVTQKASEPENEENEEGHVDVVEIDYRV